MSDKNISNYPPIASLGTFLFFLFGAFGRLDQMAQGSVVGCYWRHILCQKWKKNIAWVAFILLYINKGTKNFEAKSKLITCPPQMRHAVYITDYIWKCYALHYLTFRQFVSIDFSLKVWNEFMTNNYYILIINLFGLS